MMKRPRFTLMHILVVTAIIALIVSIFLPSVPMHCEPMPERIFRNFLGIAYATRNYISDTRRYPRTLEDLSKYHAYSQPFDGKEPPRIGDLRLEGIIYTPEFLGLSGAKPVILAYAPVEGQKKRAVLYFVRTADPLDYYGDDHFMRSQEELEAELTALRQMLVKEGKGGAIPSSQSSPSK